VVAFVPCSLRKAKKHFQSVEAVEVVLVQRTEKHRYTRRCGRFEFTNNGWLRSTALGSGVNGVTVRTEYAGIG